MNIWRGQMELHRDKVGQTLEAKENMMVIKVTSTT
jgi:hypothetical protein